MSCWKSWRLTEFATVTFACRKSFRVFAPRRAAVSSQLTLKRGRSCIFNARGALFVRLYAQTDELRSQLATIDAVEPHLQGVDMALHRAA